MSAPSEILNQWMEEKGINESDEWPISISFMPRDGDNAICIYDTAGDLRNRSMRDGQWARFAGLMVHVRSLDYPTAYQEAELICGLMDVVYKYQISMADGIYEIQNLSRKGDIIPMGIETEDDRRRHIISINLLMTAYLLDSESSTLLSSESITFDSQSITWDRT